MVDASAIRDAATIILVRDVESQPSVLMGQRGAKAAFMPNKFVFPGGGVDASDALVDFHMPLSGVCDDRLEAEAIGIGASLAAAAIRELWEETGLMLGQRASWAQNIAGWEDFVAAGYRPDASALIYFFRAITPPGRTRRFDARFFIADAGAVATDLDDFERATDELSHLQWIPMQDARKFDLPFITEVVLSEVAGALPALGAPSSIPFFNNTDEQSLFERLGGKSPLD